MALHSPVHHAGMAGSHLYRNFLIAIVLAFVAVALIAVLGSVRVSFSPGITPSDEARGLIEYRAAERADWVAGMTTEGGSLLEFRAAERTSE